MCAEALSALPGLAFTPGSLVGGAGGVEDRLGSGGVLAKGLRGNRFHPFGQDAQNVGSGLGMR